MVLQKRWSQRKCIVRREVIGRPDQLDKLPRSLLDSPRRSECSDMSSTLPRMHARPGGCNIVSRTSTSRLFHMTSSACHVDSCGVDLTRMHAAVQEEGEEPKAFSSVNWVLAEDELDLETQVLHPQTPTPNPQPPTPNMCLALLLSCGQLRVPLLRCR